MTKLFYSAIFSHAILAMTSCSRLKDFGEFRSKDGRYRLLVNSDSTFEYNYKFHFYQNRSNGIFSLQNSKTLLLNSNIDNRIIPMEVKEENCNVKENYFEMDYNFPGDDIRYYKCHFYVNGKLYDSKHCDSLRSVRINIPIDNFSFSFSADDRMPGRFLDTLSTKRFRREGGQNCHMKVKFTIVDSFFNYRIFNNVTIRASNKKLIFFDKGKRIELNRLVKSAP